MWPKYKGNGHNFGDTFVLAITFYQTHIFLNRFGCWSAFFLYFENTSLKAIFMAISKLGHNDNYGYFPLLAGLNGLYGCLFEIQQKWRPTAKTVSIEGLFHRFSVYRLLISLWNHLGRGVWGGDLISKKDIFKFNLDSINILW